jgi:hypothetical protein
MFVCCHCFKQAQSSQVSPVLMATDARSILLQTAERMRALGDEKGLTEVERAIQMLDSASLPPEASTQTFGKNPMLGNIDRSHSLHFSIATSDAPTAPELPVLQLSLVTSSAPSHATEVDNEVSFS